MGRTAIFMVMGFSAIFLFAGKNMSDVSVTALDNAMNYYEHTQLNAIATAGSNFACSKMWSQNTWRKGFSNVPFGGGLISVTAADIPHGMVKITTTATYQGSTKQTVIVMVPSSFAKFAFYGGTHASAAMWEHGDTIGGPNHTQGKLKTYDDPVFLGKTTSLSGLTMAGSKNPQFKGGYTSGISIPMPAIASYTDIYNAANTGGHAQTTGNLYLKFNADGTIDWKTSSGGVYTHQTLASFAPNGIIAIDKGTLWVEGTVPGRVTLASIRSGGSSGGAVNITNNLVLRDNPQTNPNSTDVLGVVSYGDITVKDNGATLFQMQGSYYSYQGGLQVENFNSRPPGNLKVYGGIMVEYLYATSNGAAGNARRGYNLRTDFDERLADVGMAPDYFPRTASFEILSWLE
ncbi:MAG: hypothetical protein PHP42_10315 [Bacteroidota bacterium]|nr:hypothetical protein [Bacteroidota bacterium]